MHEKLLWKLTFNCENEWTCDKIDKMFTFDQLVLSISTFSVTDLIFFTLSIRVAIRFSYCGIWL